MENFILINTALTSVLFVLFILYLIVKHRVKIVRFTKKKQVIRFCANVVIPFTIPLLLSLFEYDDSFNFVLSKNIPIPVYGKLEIQ